MSDIDLLQFGHRAMERDGLTAKELSNVAAEYTAQTLYEETAGTPVPAHFPVVLGILRAPYKEEQRLAREAADDHASQVVTDILSDLGVA